MDYLDIYYKRLNKYGNDYQGRMKGQRVANFEQLLKKSLYYINFVFQQNEEEGLFERQKQDETETRHCLLTRLSLKIPAGTILFLPEEVGNPEAELRPWMVYFKEEIPVSGYNKYIMLKMSHFITWQDREGVEQSTWAYLYGQEDNMLKDEIRSRSRMSTIYTENLKMSFFVCPVNNKIQKGDYFTLRKGTPLEKGYVVTGFDLDSTLLVEYVTVDPVYLRDTSPIPELDETDDSYWLHLEEGGK